MTNVLEIGHVLRSMQSRQWLLLWKQIKDNGLKKMEYQLQNERLHDYSVVIMTIINKGSKTLHYVTKISGK